MSTLCFPLCPAHPERDLQGRLPCLPEPLFLRTSVLNEILLGLLSLNLVIQLSTFSQEHQPWGQASGHAPFIPTHLNWAAQVVWVIPEI